jgi:hypothetical protein
MKIYSPTTIIFPSGIALGEYDTLGWINFHISPNFVYTMVLCEYMKSIRNGVNNLSDNMHVRIKIYLEFYHSIII